jgi:3-oxoadipate enol-lactonase/4-carboxymuconolactone decarboxylase
MTPSITAVRMTGARNRVELPLLVLGPSLGTTAATLWTTCAAGLTDHFDVLAWDLPGHGHNRGVPEEPFTMAELAAGVLAVVDDVLVQREQTRGTFAYAGDSAGGAVGLQLLLDAPERVTSAVLISTGARVGTAETWQERIEQVRSAGTAAMVSASAERWFAPGFLEREPAAGSALLTALEQTVDAGYVQGCAALADFDVRSRLGEIAAPVLVVSGAADVVTTTAGHLRPIADGVRRGRLVELDGVAHLAPVEAPEATARLVREHLLGPVEDADDGSTPGRGLDRRSRSLVTLTALVARGLHEDLAPHVRAARATGLGAEEIEDLLRQTALHCSVPDADSALRIVRGVLEEGPQEGG